MPSAVGGFHTTPNESRGHPPPHERRSVLFRPTVFQHRFRGAERADSGRTTYKHPADCPRASPVRTTDQPVRIGNHGRPVGRFNALIHERRLRDPLHGDSRAGALGVSVGPKPESTQHTRALPPATRRLDTGEDASYPSDYRDVTSYVLFGIEQRTATPPGRSPERAHLGSRRGSYCSCYTPAFTPARGPTGRPAG